MRLGKADVAIFGGGIAGSIAALSLARAGYDTLLCDRPPSRPDPGEGLSIAGVRLLEHLDLGSLVRRHSRPWVGTGSCWAGQDRIDKSFLTQAGEGRQLDRSGFEHALRQMAFDQLGPSRVCSADQVGLFHDQHWTLRSIAGTVAGTTNATILIDATGRRRAVARAIGIGSISADRLVAWHGAIGTSASPPLTLEIKAAPDGWWYGCGGNERQAVLCFLTDGGRASQTLAEKLIARPEAETLARHFFARPSDWTPKPYPAGTSWLAEPAGADWLAIGDAALALDPLSGQGLEFAIASAVRGAAAAAAALRGEKSAIALYAAMVEQRRRWMLRARTDVYRLNRRWPHEEFWRRRQGVEPIAA